MTQANKILLIGAWTSALKFIQANKKSSWEIPQMATTEEKSQKMFYPLSNTDKNKCYK